MPTIENITAKTPNVAQIWGFQDPITIRDVAKAVNVIARGLSGGGHEIHIMSGTHSICRGTVGVRATCAEKFADTDRFLVNPRTRDNQTVTVVVHDFNTEKIASAPDPVAAVRSKLIIDLRSTILHHPATVTLLLAYGCSAVTLKSKHYSH